MCHICVVTTDQSIGRKPKLCSIKAKRLNLNDVNDSVGNSAHSSMIMGEKIPGHMAEELTLLKECVHRIDESGYLYYRITPCFNDNFANAMDGLKLGKPQC